MMSKSEIIEWLNALDGEPGVAVNDGGLTLVEIVDGQETGNYLEVGGIPLPEEEQ